jgi:hypothetical protein
MAITPTQGTYSWSRELVGVEDTLWESGWLSPQGEHENVRVISIEVSLVAQGNTLLNLQWSWDWSTDWKDAGSQYMSPPATQKTLSEPPVMGPDDSISRNYFKIGTHTISNDRIVRVRWDVNTGLCEAMKFKLVGSTPFQFVGYSMTYSTQQIMGLNTKAKS